jgi:hypothetical protein
MDNIDSLSLLVDELSSFQFPSHTKNLKEKDVDELKEEDIQQYVLKQSKALIDAGVGTVQDLAPLASQGQNPDDIAALAEVMSATSKLIDTLHKSTLLDKKAQKDEKLKLMDIAAKKEIAQLAAAAQKPTNMNVLVASREDIMKKLFPKETNVIEIENS